MSDMQDWMHWQPSRQRRLQSIVLEPARIVVGIGAAIAVVASVMPWAEGITRGHAGFEPVFFSGTGGAGDGVVLLLVSAAAGLLTVHRTPATSRVRSIRLAPAILVVLAVCSWLNGYRAVGLEVAAWIRNGGSGGPAPGLWLAALGIVLMAAGTAWLLPPVIRWQSASGDPSDLIEVSRGGVARVIAGIAGTFVGAAVGMALTAGRDDAAAHRADLPRGGVRGPRRGLRRHAGSRDRSSTASPRRATDARCPAIATSSPARSRPSSPRACSGCSGRWRGSARTRASTASPSRPGAPRWGSPSSRSSSSSGGRGARQRRRCGGSIGAAGSRSRPRPSRGSSSTRRSSRPSGGSRSRSR